MKMLSKDLTEKERYKFLLGGIIPRAILLIATLNETGKVNAAPFSLFIPISTDPAIVGFAIGGEKDTLNNILQGREFTANLVTEEMAGKMNLAAADYPPEISEVEEVALTTRPSETIAVPLIQESPVNLECSFLNCQKFGNHYFVMGTVQAFHFDDRVMESETKRLRYDDLKALGRIAGEFYCKTTGMYSLKKAASYQEIMGKDQEELEDFKTLKELD